MSGRGIDFLENWVNKNVTAAYRKGSQDRATELAAQCYADAAALGITMNDMEPECLCKDLETQGRLLKKRMKLKLPNLNETDFQIAEEKGLMPNQLNYRQWDDDIYYKKKT